MDILRFINSRDIREYLRKTEYTFSTLEAAWLIEQCRDSSIAERHMAWEQLITEYPDCPVPERINTIQQDSLYCFLREYMAAEDRLLAAFLNPEGAVYQAVFHYHQFDPRTDDRVFSRFEPEKMTEHLEEDDWEEIRYVECRKLPVDRKRGEAGRACLSAKLRRDLGICRLDGGTNLNEDDSDLLYGVFPGFWFDIPTPFRKGDILWDPDKPDGFCGGPFVCQSINLHGIADDKRYQYLRENGDTSDMTAHGLFVDEPIGVYGEVMSNYMNLEYYPKELTGIRRLLIPFSAFEKDEIDAELLAHAYHQIMLETKKKNAEPFNYTEEILKRAGIG